MTELPKFPSMPDPGYEELDNNGEWKDSNIGYLSADDMRTGKYRRKQVTNEMKRKYAHEIIDYIADIAEIGPVCGKIESRALLIFVNKDREITFAVVENETKG